MKGVLSLRGRLTAIILVPLLFVAMLVGLWQLNNAQRTATEVFDNSMLAAALAVANDVGISGGDALSPNTGAILSDTSGGPVFYHVYAPDGVIVAGYATPPVGIPSVSEEAAGPTYFDATYLGRAVHGVRLQNTTQIDGFTGIFTTTVWQDASVRQQFVNDLLLRSVLAISGLMAALALIVWFGVRRGLRPLTELEAAIERRTSDELTPIQRAVPDEVQGIVRTLNGLFAQVSQSMTAQSEFISNAAHQLRNPIAGVLSLAEAVHAAPDSQSRTDRSKDLLDAARETADLSQKLLLLERAKSISPQSAMERIELDLALVDWVNTARDDLPEGVGLRVAVDDGLSLTGDATMMREAVRNLIDNAIVHGGEEMSQIEVSAVQVGKNIVLSVEDNGIGLAEDAFEAAKERFRPVAETSKSGLGLSLVETVVRGHGGTLELVPSHGGLRVELHLPKA